MPKDFCQDSGLGLIFKSSLSFFGIHDGLLHFDNVSMPWTLVDVFQEFLKASFIALCLTHNLERVSPSSSCVLKRYGSYFVPYHRMSS